MLARQGVVAIHLHRGYIIAINETIELCTRDGSAVLIRRYRGLWRLSVDFGDCLEASCEHRMRRLNNVAVVYTFVMYYVHERSKQPRQSQVVSSKISINCSLVKGY